MRHGRRLIAIKDPAPSIPASFRLYHGGASKGGYLVTNDPESNDYVGDYVYFSTVKAYARTYLHRRKNKAASLFVIDARYLPKGTLVLRSDRLTEWPPRPVVGRIFDLIDTQSDLRFWIRLLTDTSTRTMLDPGAPAEVRQAVVDSLKEVRYLRRVTNQPNSPPLTSARTLHALKAYFRRFLEPRVGAALAQLAPLDEEYACRDRWRSVAVFLLDVFGTLDLAVKDLRAALSRYRKEWLAKFAFPISASNVGAMRQLGMVADPDGESRQFLSGTIVIVPGRVPVLDARFRAGRLQSRRRRVGLRR
jgi:hypothetical protein